MLRLELGPFFLELPSPYAEIGALIIGLWLLQFIISFILNLINEDEDNEPDSD